MISAPESSLQASSLRRSLCEWGVFGLDVWVFRQFLVANVGYLDLGRVSLEPRFFDNDAQNIKLRRTYQKASPKLDDP